MGFSDQVKKHLDKYKRRMNYVARDATYRVLNEAQQTIPSGGNLPIDTGFLRSSLAGKIGSLPSGQTSGDGAYVADTIGPGESASSTIIRWQPHAGEKFFAGWTASYARFMNMRYGYMTSAVEKWEDFVAYSAAEAKRKIR